MLLGSLIEPIKFTGFDRAECSVFYGFSVKVEGLGEACKIFSQLFYSLIDELLDFTVLSLKRATIHLSTFADMEAPFQKSYTMLLFALGDVFVKQIVPNIIFNKRDLPEYNFHALVLLRDGFSLEA